MENLDLEKKYIEERIHVLKALQKQFGDKIIEIAAEAKKKLMEPRIRKKYKKELPVNMQRFFEIIFGDFEGIDRIIDFEVIKKTDKELEVRMNKCWYAEIYRSLGAADIGEKLICDMDPEMNKALNPKISMERPKKLMCGDDCCIFKYRLEG
jgi:predicted ArsR family transcriptional regulator